MDWCKRISSIRINILRRKFQWLHAIILMVETRNETETNHLGWSYWYLLQYILWTYFLTYCFSLDEKEIFVGGEPKDNPLKNDFNEEYTLDITDVKFVSEKGFFHLFGELLLPEINFVRNEAPDKTECVLALGEEAGKSLCPEHESFPYDFKKYSTSSILYD